MNFYLSLLFFLCPVISTNVLQVASSYSSFYSMQTKSFSNKKLDRKTYDTIQIFVLKGGNLYLKMPFSLLLEF